MPATKQPRTAPFAETPLGKALLFAVSHSPYYKAEPWAMALRQGGKLRFTDIPITPVSLVKANSALFYTPSTAADQGKILTKYTSGSTGEPLEIRMTRRASLENHRENRRLFVPWEIRSHKRVVRVRDPGEDKPTGTIEDRSDPGGFQRWTIYSQEGREVADLLQSTGATFVNGVTSTLQAALEHNQGLTALRLVGSLGEIINEQFQSLVESVPGRRLFDSYGCTPPRRRVPWAG
jgi:acyl-coenzyme A synthetase/AMP-(fatty) acid ligase